jgi:putative transposase
MENEILRSKLPARITVTPKERQRLLKFGAQLGKSIRHLITIVSPDTFLRWVREDKRAKKKARNPAKRGRPRTADQIRELIVLMAKENNWGYCRIVGELRKLNIRSVTKSTVRNILKAAGLDPCPKRAGSTWDEFISRHAASLWQCDFLGQKVLTPKGIRDAFLLAFLHVETRRVILSPATFHPDEAWVTKQANSFADQARGQNLHVRYLLHDRDAKFTANFDRALKKRQIKVVRNPKCSPNCNAFVERFLGSLRWECLDHFLFFGLKHLDSVAACFVEHYLRERPHQGKENDLLIRTKGRRSQVDKQADESPISLHDVRCQQRLGGLLKHYSRKAA